ncbi:MAG TPA: hypothetical protein V6D20_22385 [Candidatus Obscuribacterales bacterium]
MPQSPSPSGRGIWGEGNMEQAIYTLVSDLQKAIALLTCVNIS